MLKRSFFAREEENTSVRESADRNVTESALMTAALLAHEAAGRKKKDSNEHQVLTLHRKPNQM